MALIERRAKVSIITQLSGRRAGRNSRGGGRGTQGREGGQRDERENERARETVILYSKGERAREREGLLN
jgi:hypothetical protein